MEKINKKNKEFVNNTIILFVGKFATQFISLLLLPFFTRYLIKEDYGFVDLLQTYITLFVPILTLRIDSAVFRFLIDKRNDVDGKKKELSNILAILFFMVFITLILSCFILFLIEIKYFPFVLLNVIILMISNVFLQILRGLGKNKEYSIASIITGLTTLIVNVLLIIKFNFNASSILISSSIGNTLCIIFVICNAKIFKYICFKEINKRKIQEILKYSVPMIPNALSWWVVNVSDRTIISFFLGTAFNAIYSVSCKFSNILNSVFSIFSMAWQETASLHINDKDKNEFFSLMINRLLLLFSSLSIFIVSVLPFVFNNLIGKDYLDSYKYIPIILYANSWNVLIGLIGGIYVAKKKTKQIANTTIVSAIINLLVHFALIKFIGLYAACISTLLSYMAMGLYRYFDCKKYVNIRLNFKKYVIFTSIYIGVSIMYLINNFFVNILSLLFVLVYIYIINKDIVVGIVGYLRHIIKNRKEV